MHHKSHRQAGREDALFVSDSGASWVPAGTHQGVIFHGRKWSTLDIALGCDKLGSFKVGLGISPSHRDLWQAEPNNIEVDHSLGPVVVVPRIG